jgi:hypothetical protein
MTNLPQVSDCMYVRNSIMAIHGMYGAVTRTRKRLNLGVVVDFSCTWMPIGGETSDPRSEALPPWKLIWLNLNLPHDMLSYLC